MGMQTGKIDQAQQALMAAHAVLKKAGLEDAQDRYFWVDPFSPAGQQVAAKLMPVAIRIASAMLRRPSRCWRRRALRPKLENPEALDAMELGARRIDFIGAKFQAAADCVNLYTEAQALVADKSRWDEISDKL